MYSASPADTRPPPARTPGPAPGRPEGVQTPAGVLVAIVDAVRRLTRGDVTYQDHVDKDHAHQDHVDQNRLAITTGDQRRSILSRFTCCFRPAFPSGRSPATPASNDVPVAEAGESCHSKFDASIRSPSTVCTRTTKGWRGNCSKCRSGRRTDPSSSVLPILWPCAVSGSNSTALSS